MPHRALRARACAALAATSWIVAASASFGFSVSPAGGSAAAPIVRLDAGTAARQAGAAEGWWAQTEQRLRDREYRFSSTRDGIAAPNRAQNLRIHATAAGLRVQPRLARDAAWSWTWHTDAWGRAHDSVPLAAREPHIADATLTYASPQLVERWDNRRDGLEQTFVIAAPPQGDGPLCIDGRVETQALQATRVGDGLEFRDAHGALALRYAGLRAWDVTGRALAASVALDGNRLSLTLDDRDAVYPVTLDPVLTTTAWTVTGDQNTSYFGWQVATAGDVNGDGYSDVVVGAYAYDNGNYDEGAAFLYLGSAQGLSTTAAWMAAGGQPTAQFGTSVASAGDVNGDGYDDVIVGAPFYDNPETDEGQAFLFLGSATGVSATPAWTAQGDLVQAEFGYSVAGAGDVNGDGYADVVVGAQYYTHNNFSFEGRALLYLGGPDGVAAIPAWSAEGGQSNAYFGCSVASAGDVNGDGLSDVIVGAWRWTLDQGAEGAAFLYLGTPTGLAIDWSWRTSGNQSNASYGLCVASAGDVNGDGYSDVIIGAQRYLSGQRNEGRAFVFAGSSIGLSTNPLWVFDGGLSEARFGECVASAGDVNGDGFADIIVGAYGWHDPEAYEGSATIFYGSVTGPSLAPSWRVESNQINARMGWSVATAGDVNGDGYSDVLVATPYGNFTGGVVNGQVALYLGAPSGPSTAAGALLERDQADAHFAATLAAAGDVNGDGFQDLLVGAPQYDDGNVDEGAAFVYLGSSAGISPTPAWTVEGEQDGAQFGAALAGGRDVNGDGFVDVVVGAPGFDADSVDAGEAQVFFGSLAGLSLTPAWTAFGDQQGAQFGAAVCMAGDVNGDGFADVAVGAPGENAAAVRDGRARVYLGGPDGLGLAAAWTADGGADSVAFGSALACPGDANGDGLSDLAAGAPRDNGASPLAGAARLYLGSLGGLDVAPVWTAQGAEPGAQLGGVLAGAGDVNGDGLGDLALGTPLAPSGGFERGAAYVYLGDAAGGLQPAADWTLLGAADSMRAGAALAGGDIDGNGCADLAVGMPGTTNGQPAEGRVQVYFGSAASLADTSAWSAESNAGGAQFGSACALTDINGDGYADLDIGAPYGSNGESAEGRLSHFGGNGGPGLARLLRQARTTDLAPLGPGALSDRGDGVRLMALGRASGGRQRLAVEFEVKPLLTAFDGTGTVVTAWQQSTHPDSGNGLGSIVDANQLIAGLSPLTAYHWRARTRTTWAQFPRTPWLVYGAAGNGTLAFRTNDASSAHGAGSDDTPAALALALHVGPSPARGMVRIAYTLPASARVEAGVYDIAGRCVARVLDAQQAAGTHAAHWDARGADGRLAPTGVYVLRLRAGALTTQRSFVVTR